MTTQPPTIEERVSRLEGSYERISDLVQQFEGFRTETNRQFENARAETNRQFDSMRAEMNSAVRNLYVITAGSWVTLMATIIGLNLAT